MGNIKSKYTRSRKATEALKFYKKDNFLDSIKYLWSVMDEVRAPPLHKSQLVRTTSNSYITFEKRITCNC
jgi:hypothetical protein